MCWAWYGGIYSISGGIQKLHAAKPSACAWNWSLTRNWDYIKIKSTFFPVSHETNIYSHLKVVCLQCRKKNLKLDYRWENPSFQYIYSAITTMSYPLWTQLAVSEQGCTLKNTLLLLQIPPPFPAGTCIILTILSWLGEGYQEWQCGKAWAGWDLCGHMSHAAGAGFGQPEASVEMAAHIPLFPSWWQKQYQPADRLWESQGTSLDLAFVQGRVLRDAPFYIWTT